MSAGQVEAAKVLTALAERKTLFPMHQPLPERLSIPQEAPWTRVFLTWITPHNCAPRRLPVEALTKHEAHGLAREAARRMFPGRTFTVMVKS